MMITATAPATASAPSPAIRETAQQFEAIFLRQMIATMRAPSLGDDIFGSDASNQFRDMSDARLADAMAGQLGIAQILEKQLAK